MSPSPPVVLTFAASDPTGGAGVQADLLTLAAMGCHPLSVLTALTVQDTSGVVAVLPITGEWVLAQATRVLDDIEAAAFKLGVLGSRENAAAVARVLAEHPHVPVVVDPVLASGRGDPLAAPEVVEALRELILPRASVATPNSLEAAALGGPQALLATGCRYVLVTGTHEPGPEVVNRLYEPGGAVREDRWARLPGEYHGSGCTLASALAAAMANGRSVPEAAHDAQEYTWGALAHGFRPGRGQALPDRLFWARSAERVK